MRIIVGVRHTTVKSLSLEMLDQHSPAASNPDRQGCRIESIDRALRRDGTRIMTAPTRDTTRCS
jgi:nicotinamide mononucleotide adenylyltransferase